MKDELADCVLRERLTSCLRKNCMYWSDILGCIRGSLKMTQKDREAWKAQRKAEIAKMAGGNDE